MGRSGLSWDEQNNSAELHDIFSHLIDWINCLWNALATLDSESLFISFQVNWDWFGSWCLLLYTQKKGDIFFIPGNKSRHYIGKVKVELYLSVRGTWSRSLPRMANFLNQYDIWYDTNNYLSSNLFSIAHVTCSVWFAGMIVGMVSWYFPGHSYPDKSFLWVSGYTYRIFCFLILWASMIFPPLLDLFLSFWHS